jgi:hypothetical protein
MPPPGGLPSPEDADHSTWTYAQRRHGSLTAIVEVPMWACDLTADTAPHPAADSALRAAGSALRRDSARVAGMLAELRPRLPHDGGPLLRAAAEIVVVGPRLAADWDPALRRPDTPEPPPMTRARVSSVEIYARRLPLRAAAMLRRVAAEAGLPPAAGLRGALERLVAEWCESYRADHDARWIPVRHQAEQHARSVLATFELMTQSNA